MQTPDTRPGFYYVTVRRDDGQTRLLRGPFRDHKAALEAVFESRRAAEKLDPCAHWYAFGTGRTETDEGPGILDRVLSDCSKV